MFLILALGVCFYWFDPLAENFFPPCPFHSFTGFDCPGCGSQRALHALLHGNIKQAADHNLLLVAGLPFAVVLFLYKLKINERSPLQKELICGDPLLIRISIGLILGFWIVRNLPYAPFNYLAS